MIMGQGKFPLSEFCRRKRQRLPHVGERLTALVRTLLDMSEMNVPNGNAILAHSISAK